MRWRPHDLLRLDRLPAEPGLPDWLRAVFADAPYAVVRRAAHEPDRVPVGFRGAVRAQRHGSWVDAGAILAALPPETLLARGPAAGRAGLPAFAALAWLRDSPSVLDGHAWGPTGSTGFELATGMPAVTPPSDLDLLVRMPARPDPGALRALVDTLAQASRFAHTRVDAQVETPAGGTALAELAELFAGGKPHVLVRAADGARFSADPWLPA